MDVYTYFTDRDAALFRTVRVDPELNILLQQVRRQTKEDWLIQALRAPRHHMWGFSIFRKDSGEHYQAIDFAETLEGALSPRVVVSRELAKAFLNTLLKSKETR